MKRVLLKLSGEALANGSGEIYDIDFVDRVASVLVRAAKEGYELAVVVGAEEIKPIFRCPSSNRYAVAFAAASSVCA